jgi:hypothetical protein
MAPSRRVGSVKQYSMNCQHKQKTISHLIAQANPDPPKRGSRNFQFGAQRPLSKAEGFFRLKAARAALFLRTLSGEAI